MSGITGLEFEGLFNAVPCYIAVLDRDLTVVTTNRIAKQHFGPHEGRKCFEVFKNRSTRCESCPAVETLIDGIIRKTESVTITLEGNEIKLLVTVRPLHDSRGEIVGVMEVSTDITELKKLQLELEASQERRRRDFEHFRQLFDEVPCYVSVMDEQFTILETNRMFKETLGDVPGAKCFELFKGRSSPCGPCPVAETFADGLPHSHESRIKGLSGREVDVVIRSAPIIGKDGKVQRVMELAADVTAIKDLQRELARLGKMSAHAAHNIKGILTGLKGGIFMVNEGRKRDDQPVVDRGWEMVQHNVDRIATQSLDILSFAKKREPQYVEVDVRRLFSDALDGLEGRVEGRDVTMSSEVADGVSTVLADGSQLNRMLTVLVENALEACLECPGENPHRIDISASREGEWLRIRVRDDGAGMNAEVKKHVFEDFYSTKGSLGTGLGLVLVQKIVAEHGGSLEFESAEGDGTTFTVHLPVGRVPAPSRASP
jgi:PAS domain S-box-containing protein